MAHLFAVHYTPLSTVHYHCPLCIGSQRRHFHFFILYFHMLADGQLYTVAILVHNILTQLIVMMMCTLYSSLRVCLNCKGWWSHIVMHCTLHRSKYDLTQLKLHLLLCSQLHEDSKVEGKKRSRSRRRVWSSLVSLLHKSVARSSGGQVVLIIS